MAETVPKTRTADILKKGAAVAAIGGAALVPAVNAESASNRENITLTEATASRISHQHRHHKRHSTNQGLQFTGYQVEGPTSTFGWPSDGSHSDAENMQTADGGNADRPCIAIKNDSTLDRKFQVTIFYNHHKFQAIEKQCDWGPAERAIDQTGQAAQAEGINPYNYPTDSFGIARELK